MYNIILFMIYNPGEIYKDELDQRLIIGIVNSHIMLHFISNDI